MSNSPACGKARGKDDGKGRGKDEDKGKGNGESQGKGYAYGKGKGKGRGEGKGKGEGNGPQPGSSNCSSSKAGLQTRARCTVTPPPADHTSPSSALTPSGLQEETGIVVHATMVPDVLPRGPVD